MSGETTLHLRISGRVQGVGYRAWLQQAARHLKIAGWVRNRRDGTVEAMVGGAAGDVARLVEMCHSGPSAACVTSVARQNGPDGELPLPFEGWPTI